ncbi:peptidyl-prolyl cis-trans isomerase [Brevibacillus ginsengisoli]|uniref:peptidyl-prolyl cis-trans isomerase n=1 Tax=Brevibacillus ginsengisoli TaxID=363854 RepID=UPI003CF6A7E2
MNNVRVLWALIGGLVLLLAVVSWSWYKQAGHVQTMAVVGKESISESAWMQTLKQKHGQQVLSEMINRQVVNQEAKRLGITVDEKRVQAELENMQESDGSGSQFLDLSVHKEAGSGNQELMDEIRYRLLLEEIAIKDIEVDEARIRDYYESHRAEFGQPARAQLSIITVATEAEAEQVLQDLEQGANFATLAKERSIDSLTAPTGGEMGWISLANEAIPRGIRETVPTLKIGQDSKPIPVVEGFAVIRVLQSKKANQLSYGEAKDTVRRQMALAQVSLEDALKKLKLGLGVTVQSENGN